DYAQSIIQTSDGGYAIAGDTISYGAGNSDMYITKLTSSGALDTSFGSSGTRTVGGTGSDHAYSIIQTSDGGYAIAGYTNSYGAGGRDMYIIKLNSDGNLGGSCTNPSLGSGGSISTGGTVNNGGTTGTGGTVSSGGTISSGGTLNQQCTASGTNANQTVFNVNNYGQVGIGANANLGYRLNVNGLATSNGWLTSSDKRFKTNIKTLDNSLEKLTQLNGVSYSYDTENFKDRGFDDNKHMGLLAQDVAKIFPELVYTDATGYKSVDYIGLIAPMINSITDQQGQIERSNVTITSNTLQTDKNINTLSQLQDSVDTQFSTASEILNQTTSSVVKLQDDNIQVRDNILALQSEANVQADIIGDVEDHMKDIENTQTELMNFFLSINPDTLVYTDDIGNLTLDGVMSVGALTADSIAITGEKDGATIGEGIIEKDTRDVFVPTTAANDNSRIFVTPKGGVVLQTISVSRIDDGNGFYVTVANEVDVPISFDWFIVEDNISEG
ncbi:MAG: tail fiber domain-containing protein, partial [Patescibacteria group bacterium]|nr:tail fiber domain-containing protein [Patescibacteria group bacterium]